MKLGDLESRINREPFRPFIIELASGRQIGIAQDTEMLFPKKRPELIITFTGDGLMHLFEISAVHSIIE